MVFWTRHAQLFATKYIALGAKDIKRNIAKLIFYQLKVKKRMKSKVCKMASTVLKMYRSSAKEVNFNQPNRNFIHCFTDICVYEEKKHF